MSRLNTAFRLALILGLAEAASTPALAQYKFKTFPGPRGGSQIYEGVNNSRDILTEVTTAAEATSCALIQKTNTTPIDDPNSTFTQCYGLDNGGKIVGYYVPASDQNTAVGFIFAAGAYSDFTATGSVAANGGTQLNAISPNGKIIAGNYADVNGYLVAFTLRGNKQTDISISGADYLVAAGVNDAGDLTLQSFDAGHNIITNYLVAGSTVTQIAYPNAARTTVHAINDNGILVGNFTNSAGVEQGFTYHMSSGSYSDPIADPKDADTVLIGINDKGLIVGDAVTSKNAKVGLVARPIK